MLICVLLAACQQSNPAPARPAGHPKNAQDLAAYRELRAKKSWELAASIGADLVARAPGTPEAAEVKLSLDEVQATAAALREGKRLKQLWTYQVGTESGGAQSTASIYSSTPGSEAERVDLILRRHADWGDSVYLFGHPPGFACGSACSVAASFDGAPAIKLKAYAPPTGEPALMFSDEKGFIEKLAKAQTITLDVALKGKGAQALSYEVGGYDSTRFAELSSKKK